MFWFDGTLDIFEYRTTDKYCTEAERNLTLATSPNSTTQRMLDRCKQRGSLSVYIRVYFDCSHSKGKQNGVFKHHR